MWSMVASGRTIAARTPLVPTSTTRMLTGRASSFLARCTARPHGSCGPPLGFGPRSSGGVARAEVRAERRDGDRYRDLSHQLEEIVDDVVSEGGVDDDADHRDHAH